MTEENKLKKDIQSIRSELEEITKERDGLLDKIEDLEELILKYDEVLDKKASSGEGSTSKEIQVSRLELELDSKEKKIRELKDSLGYIRLEKIELQRELELIKKQQNQGKVVRIEEEEKSPLDLLVKELQEKIHKQETEIRRLKQESQKVDELILKLKEREEEISLIKQNTNREENKKRENSNSFSHNLTQELQVKLNKAKTEINELKKQISEYKGRDKLKNEILNGDGKEIDTMESLRKLVQQKDNQLKTLQEKVINLEKNRESSSKIEKDSVGYSTSLVSDLQNQLRKAKLQIESLQTKLKKKANPDNSTENSKLDEISKLLNEHKLKIKELNQIVEEQELKIETKEEELGKINKELNQIRLENKDLEQKITLKNQQIDILEGQLKSKRDGDHPKPVLSIDPELSIRIKELENYLEELKSENESQRVEILKLKKRSN